MQYLIYTENTNLILNLMIDWFFSEEEEISTIPKWNILTQFRINEFLPSWILLNSIISIAYLPSFRKIQILKNIPHVTYIHTHNPLDVSSEGSSSLRNCEFPRSQSSESPRLPDNQEVTRVSICTIQIQTMLPSLTINLVWRRDRSMRPFWGPG